MSQVPYAEAIFGSVSRGDADHLSDRDILLVGERYDELTERRTELAREGWSVACYTWAKLTALAESGALFLQHLKTEARITHDVSSRLRTLLNAFRPKPHYSPDLTINSRLARLASTHPATKAGALWAADVLYVAVRNFGVLTLANERQYVFWYADILDALIQRGLLPTASKSDLLKLRLAKSLYRHGDLMPAVNSNSVIANALRWLPIEHFPTRSLPVAPQLVLSNADPLPDQLPAYHRLRNLERLHIALFAVEPSTAALPEMEALVRWIENPRAYTNLAAHLETAILEKMRTAVAGLMQAQRRAATGTAFID